MQHMKLKLAAAVAAALLSTNAMADSWAVTQSSTAGLASNGAITQDSSTGSLQAINAIKSTTASVTGSQTSTQTSKLKLEQKGTTANSNQAANYIETTDVGSSGSQFVQTLNGDQDAELAQSAVTSTANADTANIQGFNVAKGNTLVNLKQDANAVKTVTLSQSGTGTGSTQGVNVAKSTTTVGTIEQTAATTGTAATGLEQTAASGNIQAINTVESTGNATSVTQTATATNGTTLTQKGSGANTQAANRAVSGGTIGTLTQTAGTAGKSSNLYQGAGGGTQALNIGKATGITSKSEQKANGVATLDQGNTAGVMASVGTQAGNALEATSGEIKLATQDFNAAGTDSISLNQVGAKDGSTQAGNLINVSGAGASLTDGTQTIGKSSPTVNISLSQNTASSKSLQAGNAVITGSGSTTNMAKQYAYGNQLAMTQSGSSNSYQAVNYVGVAPQ